jgi:hypothetical protein
MTKQEIKGQLNTICDEIMKEIIEPICGISGAVADYWLADISVYTSDDEVLNQVVYEKIQEKYNLTEDEMISIDSFVPLMQIALFIFLEKERPQYQPMFD